MIDITQLCWDLVEEPNQYFYHKTFQRHIDDLHKFKDSKEIRFNNKLANIYIAVMGSFKHFKGSEFAGQNFKLEKWQKAVVGICMGWEKKNIHGEWIRRFHTANFFMARKNGKTFISAGLALADMIIRPEPQGEIVCVATKRDQAKIAWSGIYSMIKAHNDLKKLFRKVGNTLTFTKDDTTVTTLGRDSNTEDGANFSFAIIDELHAHSSSEMIDVVRSSMGARKQPFTLIISTAGFDLGSPLVSEVQHSRDILNGLIEDDGYFAFICEPDIEMDPFTEDAWRAANPNYGVSVSKEYIQTESESASQRPDRLVNYLTKHLNKFVNESEVFLPIDDWKACSSSVQPQVDISQAIFVAIGSDLSIIDDWTSVSTTYLFEDNSIYTKNMFFIPTYNIKNKSNDLRIPLQEWVDKGYVRETKGNTINYEEVYKYIIAEVESVKKLNIPIFHGYDPFKAKWIVSKLENEFGFSDNVSVSQGFKSLTEPLNMLLTYVKSHQITYEFNPVLNWMASNISIVFDSYGNIKPEKSDRNRKIDGIASLLNTLYILIPHFHEQEETSEIIWL